MATKAYSYLRFSTPEQAHGDSARRQSTLAQEYAARHGLELDDTLTYRDEGVSAFRGLNMAEGSRLGAFLAAVREGVVAQGSYLLVENLDRISRDKIRAARNTLEEIVDSGIVVVTLNDGKAYTKEMLDEDGLAMIMVVLTFMRAHEESATKARRGKEAWKGKLLKGGPLTRVCPAWLTLRADRSTYDVVKDRAKLVQRIYSMALEGIGQQSIARMLNAEGVPTWGLGIRKPAGMWQRSYIAKLLGSPAVIGTYVPHAEEYQDGKLMRKPLDPIPGYFPAVIDEETFQRVQAMRASADPLRGRHAGHGVHNVFGGLLRCNLCGSSMQMVYKGQGQKGGQRKVVCSKARGGHGCNGAYRSISYPMLEHTLRENAALLLSTARQDFDEGRIAETISETEERIQEVEQGAQILADELQRTPSPTLRTRLLELDGERDRLKVMLREMESRLAQNSGPLIERKIADLKAALKVDSMDRAQVNMLLRQLCRTVTVDYPTAALEFEWLHGGAVVVPFETA